MATDAVAGLVGRLRHLGAICLTEDEVDLSHAAELLEVAQRLANRMMAQHGVRRPENVSSCQGCDLVEAWIDVVGRLAERAG